MVADHRSDLVGEQLLMLQDPWHPHRLAPNACSLPPLAGTFDCPCHGSYFDRYGRVIQGPAKADLQPVEPGILGIRPRKTGGR